jgi:competence protein ComEC
MGQLRDGSLVAIANTIEAFDEDCRRAAVVLTARDTPPGCAALVVDRQTLKHSGAVALRRMGKGFEMTPSRPAGYDRPWARAIPGPTDRPETGQPSPARRQPPDATPSIDDMEPGD